MICEQVSQEQSRSRNESGERGCHVAWLLVACCNWTTRSYVIYPYTVLIRDLVGLARLGFIHHPSFPRRVFSVLERGAHMDTNKLLVIHRCFGHQVLRVSIETSWWLVTSVRLRNIYQYLLFPRLTFHRLPFVSIAILRAFLPIERNQRKRFHFCTFENSYEIYLSFIA